MTEYLRKSTAHSARLRHVAPGLAVICMVCAVVPGAAVLTGCSPDSSTAGRSQASDDVGTRMAGPAVEINVTQEALDNEPPVAVLTSPESAVRSYLDWTSYAYRIGQSQVALPTMTAHQEVRVDSYIQYNVQQRRLIDQTLQSITFGTPSVESTHTLLPARETWTYSYVSIARAGEIIGGPYEATYDATYVVVRNDRGDWVVDSAEAKPLGKIQ
jgi:hypothetical protein